MLVALFSFFVLLFAGGAVLYTALRAYLAPGLALSVVSGIAVLVLFEVWTRCREV